MKRGPAMRRLLRPAMRGLCFCGRRLPRARVPRVMCQRRECRAEYQAAYREDNYPPSDIRTIVRRARIVGKPGWVCLVLECGHRYSGRDSEMHEKGTRKHCAACRKRMDSVG